MAERALSFGPVAAAYEQFRPGYPTEVVSAVLAYADQPVETALEIGAGTGKATRMFAARAIAVTATDPDAAMLEQLRALVPAGVTTLRSSFEDLALTFTYDLVFAAAALHWTEPGTRWPRMASLLKPAGVFANIAGQSELSDPALDQAVDVAKQEFLPDDGVPAPDGTPSDHPMQWPGTELLLSEQFTDVRQTTVERRMTMPATQYLGYLSTVSAYLQLAEPTRREVFRRIAAVLPDHVDVTADLTIHLARRA